MAAVHEDIGDISSAGSEDEQGGQVVDGGQMGGIEVDEDEVGALADLEAADEVVDAEGSGSLDGGRADDLGGRGGGRS